MKTFYQLSRNGHTEIRKGTPKPIHIKIENRQGGRKHLTHVTGVETFAIPPEELAQQLKVKCAASTTLRQLPAKGSGMVSVGSTLTGKDIVIQGSVTDEVISVLTEQWFIPKRFIEAEKASKKKGASKQKPK